eukprot:m.161563 g.161563  ORF g.161563 m.161563 type:complete len:411 (-) comp31243_c0_seq1:369-1601(-)
MSSPMCDSNGADDDRESDEAEEAIEGVIAETVRKVIGSVPEPVEKEEDDSTEEEESETDENEADDVVEIGHINDKYKYVMTWASDEAVHAPQPNIFLGERLPRLQIRIKSRNSDVPLLVSSVPELRIAVVVKHDLLNLNSVRGWVSQGDFIEYDDLIMCGKLPLGHSTTVVGIVAQFKIASEEGDVTIHGNSLKVMVSHQARPKVEQSEKEKDKDKDKEKEKDKYSADESATKLIRRSSASRPRKKRKVQGGANPKPLLNAYLIYSQALRSQQDKPLLASEIGAMWKALDDEQRLPFQEKERANRLLYQQQLDAETASTSAKSLTESNAQIQRGSAALTPQQQQFRPFLESLNLCDVDKVHKQLVENEITDVDVARLMHERHFTECNLKLGARLKIMHALGTAVPPEKTK